MNKHRQPYLSDAIFLTDGGLETTLIFKEGMDLPQFASFPLLETIEGRAALRKYYASYATLARRYGTNFILESPTWRANPDWGEKLGYAAEHLVAINRDAIGLMHELREEFETPSSPFVISGCVGPRGDGYQPSSQMTAAEAEVYHTPQMRTFVRAGVDIISAFTLNYVEEALGITNAAANLNVPVVISFTVETDGNLPTGQSLGEAIRAIDHNSRRPPVYYMINCAHPTHFESVLAKGEPWVMRIRGVRANSSCRSHAELNEAPDLDEGNPVELGEQYRTLRTRFSHMTILGGCCGTDERHVEEICRACIPVPAETQSAKA